MWKLLDFLREGVYDVAVVVFYEDVGLPGGAGAYVEERLPFGGVFGAEHQQGLDRFDGLACVLCGEMRIVVNEREVLV